MAPQSPWITLRSRRLHLSYKVDRRVPLIALLILAFTIAVLVVSINYGQYKMTIGDVVQTLLGLNTDNADYRSFALVVHTFRLPRIILAFLVGMALATSGTIMQGITRNPLADPFLLGISSGAGLAAVALIVWLKNVSLVILPWAALAGALITAITIYLLAWKHGASSPMRLILIGIAVEAVITAITTTMLTFGRIQDVQQAYVWLAGSVYGRSWEHVYALGAWLLICLPLAILLARHLNTLTLGDDTAKSLGVRVEWQRLSLLVISVALAAVAVSVSGTIGFVGLVAPHITRRLVGPTHEGLIPLAALFGGAMLVLADLVGRWVVAPGELPIGIVTAMIGAPYFMYLLYRNRNN